MKGIIKQIFYIAFGVWNGITEKAIELFTTSPTTAADQDLYKITKNCYDIVIGCTVPLATLFFIIAIYKSVVSTPPEQQARKFLLDSIKYIIILYLSTQLWSILGYVMSFSDDMTTKIEAYTSTEIKVNKSDDLINEINHLTFKNDANILTSPGQFMTNFMDSVGSHLIYMIGGVITIIVLTACGVSIISVAFQRIIKPLIIMPFAAVVLGIGACSGEGERMMWHYGKSFLGLCISGAFMVLALKLGDALVGNAITEDLLNKSIDGLESTYKSLVLVVQINLAALVVAGLLKSMDGMVSKVFG
jgi:hypothetical protein